MTKYVLNIAEFLTSTLIKDDQLVWMHERAYTEGCLDELYTELTSFSIDLCCVVFDTLISSIEFLDSSLVISDFDNGIKTYLSREDFNSILHLIQSVGLENVHYFDRVGIFTQKDGAYLCRNCGSYKLININNGEITGANIIPLNCYTDAIKRAMLNSTHKEIYNGEMMSDTNLISKFVKLREDFDEKILSRLMIVAFALSDTSEKFEFNQEVFKQESRREIKEEKAEEEVEDSVVAKEGTKSRRKRESNKQEVGKATRKRKQTEGAEEFAETDSYDADIKPKKLKSNYRQKSKFRFLFFFLDVIIIAAIIASFPIENYVKTMNSYVNAEYSDLLTKVKVAQEKIASYRSYSVDFSCTNNLNSVMHLGSVVNSSEAQIVYACAKDNKVVVIISSEDKEHLEMCKKELQSLYDSVSIATQKKGEKRYAEMLLQTNRVPGNLTDYDICEKGNVFVAVYDVTVAN